MMITSKNSGHWEIKDSFEFDDYFGFIYLITNNISGKAYIGKKQFRSYFKRPPLKGRKNKRHCNKESDWRTYTSSSDYVNGDICSIGVDKFTFRIIKLCRNKSQMAYFEPFYMYAHNVLTAKDSHGTRVYYNRQIPACRGIPKF